MERQKKHGKRQMADGHKRSVFDSLSKRAHKMRDDWKDIQKHTGKKNAYHPQAYPHGGKQYRVLRIDDIEIHPQNGEYQQCKQPDDGTLLKILTERLPVILPDIRVLSAHKL